MVKCFANEPKMPAAPLMRYRQRQQKSSERRHFNTARIWDRRLRFATHWRGLFTMNVESNFRTKYLWNIYENNDCAESRQGWGFDRHSVFVVVVVVVVCLFCCCFSVLLSMFLESQGAFHSTKNFQMFETGTNSEEVSKEKFRKIRKLLYSRKAKIPETRDENQMQLKFPRKNVRKFGYTSRSCPLFPKLYKLTVSTNVIRLYIWFLGERFVLCLSFGLMTAVKI